MTSVKTLSWRDLLIVALFALVALAPGISSIPPMDRDESRYAVASTQMLTSGDFIDIRFQEQPRYLQPAGVYWLQSAAVAAVSSPEAREIWAFRLPSLFAAILAAVLTALIAGSLFGRAAGVTAGVLLAVCLSLGYEARTAKTDAALLAAVTLAQLALMRIYIDPAGPRWRAALFWAALGAGFMIKGPIIAVVCGATIAALLAWDRKASWLKGLHPLWGVPLFLAVVAPWYVAISIVSQGEFYAHALGGNFLRKVGEGQQSHGGPPGFHLGLMPVMFWPASLFALLAVFFAWRRRAEPAVRFLLCWIVPAWIVYELIATKLPHYVLPTYPALAILAAGALFATTPGEPAARGWRWAAFAACGVWFLASVLVAALAPVGLWQLEGVVDTATIAAATAAVVLSGAALFFLSRRRNVAAVAAVAAAGLVVWVNTFANAAPRLESVWVSPQINRAVDAAPACRTAPLATAPYREPSLVFLHGPHRTHIALSPANAADLLAENGGCALIGEVELPGFLARADELGLVLTAADRIEGLNYSKGEALTLTLFALEQSQPAP